MRFKRGDTFDFSGPVEVTESGTTVNDMTGWAARSQIRSVNGTLVADLTVTWVSRNPPVVRLVEGDTSEWPVGALSMDVEFESPSGTKVSTAVQTITVGEGATR